MVSSSRRSSARSRSAELGCGEKGVLGERVWIITSRLLFLPPAHPQCSDGVQGSGACLCFPDYKGIACHICSNPNKHGDQCQEGGWSWPRPPAREIKGLLARWAGDSQDMK